MSTIKTTISLQEPLFHKLEEAAEDMNISRSGALALALEAWLEKIESQKMLDALNEAYADHDFSEDREFLHKAAQNMFENHVDPW